VEFEVEGKDSESDEGKSDESGAEVDGQDSG
jgi:hypothetical protein